MSWKIKAAIIFGVMALIAVLSFIVKKQYDMLKQQEAMNQSVVEMKQLQDNWVRSSAKYVTKDDLDSFAKSYGVDLDPIRKDIASLGAELKGISIILTRTPGYVGNDLPSTGTEPNGNPTTDNSDPYGYQKNAQILALNEPFSANTNVPWGEVKFSAWRKNPWDLSVKQREYSVATIISTDENGRHYVHNQFSVGVDGKKYTVPISNSSFEEVYPNSKFSFNPRIFMGIAGGVYANPPLRGDITPNVQVHIFSYGKTKVSSDWTFLGLGGGYATKENRVNFVATPFTYNVGKHIPLMSNLYVGPSLSIDTSGNVGILGGAQVGL